MVKKLYKYEFKSYGGWVLLMYGAMIVASILLSLALNLTEDYTIFTDDYDLQKMFNDSIRSLFFIVYFISIIASFTLIIILPIVRFYKNMLTSEGYLTLSLPVTPSQHIICKTVVAYIYQIGAGVAFGISVFIIILLSGDFNEFLNLVGELLVNAWEYIISPEFKLKGQITLLILTFIIAPIATMLMFYFCLASGMLFGKYKLAGSVIVYIVLRTIRSVFLVIAQIIFMPFSRSLEDPVSWVTIISVGYFGIVVILIVMFYMLTNYMFKHRVNL